MTDRSRCVLHVLKAYRPAFNGDGAFLERSSTVMQEIAGPVAHDLLVIDTPGGDGHGAAGFCSTINRVAYLTHGPVGALRREVLLCWWFMRNLHRYDTVHFGSHADLYFLTYLMTKIARRRLVLSATLDDSPPALIEHYPPSMRWLARRGFRLFDAFVGINVRLRDQTLTLVRDPARCHLVGCGVTVPADVPGARERLRASFGIGPDDPVLLSVGGLCARRDPLSLIMAMPAVLAAHPGARLLLVGPPRDGDYVAILHAAVARAGLGDAVIFTGEQPNPDGYFAVADMLVSASRLEGFGTVLPDALAHRLPVVARRLPDVTEALVRHGETGFLFDDQGGYRDAVLRLAADPALRQSMGAAGQALVQRDFAMRDVAARFLDIYGMGSAIRLLPADAAESGLGASASIVDRRFHTPAAPAADATPLLVTMVDAEEAFDWSQPFSRDARDVSSMRCQHLAHRVFSRHGVVPVYLADYPVASHDDGRAPLREMLRDGLCDVGAQMHPWVTPPFTEMVGEDNSFAGNLPVGTELEKAKRLTGALEEAFGAAPLIWRTGRFGMGLRTADILKHLGYAADSSVSPCWPAPQQLRSPEAWHSAPAPYWVDRERSLMEIPVSAALVGRLASPIGSRLAPFLYRRRRWSSILAGGAARMGLLERIRLTPEGMTIDEGKRLTRAMYAAGHRIFVLTYHSPSLAPGNTPYVRDIAQRDRLIAWLDEYYTFFREEIGGRPTTWRDVRFGPTAPTRSLLSSIKETV